MSKPEHTRIIQKINPEEYYENPKRRLE